jgi:hypothetical protein
MLFSNCVPNCEAIFMILYQIAKWILPVCIYKFSFGIPFTNILAPSLLMEARKKNRKIYVSGPAGYRRVKRHIRPPPASPAQPQQRPRPAPQSLPSGPRPSAAAAPRPPAPCAADPRSPRVSDRPFFPSAPRDSEGAATVDPPLAREPRIP